MDTSNYNKGHEEITQKEREYSVSDTIKDSYMSLNKKVEKLTTALYMVTDCMSETEPLRHALRTKGILLLEYIVSLPDFRAVEKTSLVEESDELVTLLYSYISIATTVGLISRMNGSILLREYGIIQDTFSEMKKRNQHKQFHGLEFEKRSISEFMLDPSLFKGVVSFPEIESPTQEAKDFYKGQKDIKGQSNESSNVLYKNPSAKSVSPKPITANSDLGLRLARRNTILKIIKDKKRVTIKDITSLVTDCSEKTIQRELIGLVSEGVLKKEGEKRWSRYSLQD